MTGWGQDGPLATPPATTSTTSRSPAPCTRSAREGEAGAAAQPGRRFRRRRALPGVRHAGRVLEARELGQGPGDRRRHERRRRLADDHVLRHERQRALGRSARPTCSMAARHFYDTYQCADGKWSRSARSSRSSTRCCARRPDHDPDFARADGSHGLAGAAREAGGRDRNKTQAEWCAIMDATDVCFAPILISMRRRSIRTTPRARPSSRWRGCQPAPAPDSRAPRGRSRGRRWRRSGT